MTATEDRIRSLPLWKGPVTIEPLKGGLSNESFLVTEPGGRHVVRIGRDFPFHHVFREREIMAARAAEAAGFGPEVRFAEPGIMVTAFLGARTYGAEMFAQAERIAALIRRFHEEMPRHVSGAGFMFWVFHVIRDYARTLLAGNSRPDGGTAGAFSRWPRNSNEPRSRCQLASATTTCCRRNSLDDGERLWLIDFEYAGFNTAMFDLAGHRLQCGNERDGGRQPARRLFWRRGRYGASQSLRRDAMRLPAARGNVEPGLRTASRRARR